jgi:hypothetical protein
MNERHKQFHTGQLPSAKVGSLAALALSLLLIFAMTAAGTAQDLDEELGRGLEREAPPREAVILEQEQLSPTAVRTVLSLPAVADTYIASERPNQNFGADALFLGYNLVGDHYGAQRMLLRFDVENHIPPGSVVHDAHLRLHVAFSSPPDDTPMGTVLRRLASPWGEFTVTWNTEPEWTPVDDTTFVGSTLTWYEWEITDVVHNWVNEVFDNYGVSIIGDETIQQRERAFYSRETMTAFYPRLVVNYTEFDDTEAPVVIVDPLPEFSPRTFTVSWTGHDPGGSGIAYYDVQYREDLGAWTDWQMGVTFTQAEFTGTNGRFYEFRARGVDVVGNEEPFGNPEAHTTVDTQPPSSQVNPLPPIVTEPTFTVSWTGHDHGGSGVQYFDVQFRHNSGPWQLWQQQTIATQAIFTAPADGLYEFEVRAVDNVGNAEAFGNVPEAAIFVDIEPPFIEPRLWLPLIFRSE